MFGLVRKAARGFHRVIGLTLGLFFALAGLTGSVLVFYVEIDRALHPALWVEEPEAHIPWESSLLTLQRAFPDKTGPWRIEVRDDHGPIPARYNDPPETHGRDFAPMLVWLAPDGSRVVRRAYWGETAMTWIYDLHYRLFLNKTGGAIVGWAGLACVLLMFTGLLAWWPRVVGVAKGLHFKRGASEVRRLYDLHKLIGLCAFPILLVLAATGAMLGLPKETDRFLSSTVGTPTTPQIEAPDWSGARISVDDAVAHARSALPSARLAWIETPAPGAGFYRFRFQVAGDPSRRFPHSYIYVHPSTGAVILAHDVRAFGFPTAFKNWLHALHDGSAAGLPGRIVIFVLGLAPSLLLATGVLRRRARTTRRKKTERPARGVWNDGDERFQRRRCSKNPARN